MTLLGALGPNLWVPTVYMALVRVHVQLNTH